VLKLTKKEILMKKEQCASWSNLRQKKKQSRRELSKRKRMNMKPLRCRDTGNCFLQRAMSMHKLRNTQRRFSMNRVDSSIRIQTEKSSKTQKWVLQSGRAPREDPKAFSKLSQSQRF
jgi:hypothetical protein